MERSQIEFIKKTGAIQNLRNSIGGRCIDINTALQHTLIAKEYPALEMVKVVEQVMKELDDIHQLLHELENLELEPGVPKGSSDG